MQLTDPTALYPGPGYSQAARLSNPCGGSSWAAYAAGAGVAEVGRAYLKAPRGVRDKGSGKKIQQGMQLCSWRQIACPLTSTARPRRGCSHTCTGDCVIAFRAPSSVLSRLRLLRPLHRLRRVSSNVHNFSWMLCLLCLVPKNAAPEVRGVPCHTRTATLGGLERREGGVEADRLGKLGHRSPRAAGGCAGGAAWDTCIAVLAR